MFSFAKNINKNIGKNISKNVSSKFSQKLFDNAKQSAIDALKTASKSNCADLTGNKIANKITEA